MMINTPYLEKSIRRIQPMIASLVGPAGDPWDQRVRSQFIGKDLVSGLLVYELPLRSLRKKYRLSLKNDIPPRDKDVIEFMVKRDLEEYRNRGPTWLFDLDYLTDSMNYQPVRSENQANKHAGPQEANQNAGTKENIDAGDSPIEAESAQDYLCDCQFGFLTTSTVKCSKNVKITSIPDIKQDPQSVCVKTRSKVTKSFGAYAFVSYIQKQRRNNHNDFQHCLFACFLSQNEPKKISEALEDESWVDAMQEELLQFKIQKVWILVDLPYGKKAIGTKWVYRNKKDERGVVVRNKARMDVKSAFLYAKLHEGVYGVSTSRFLSHSLVSLEGSTMYVKDLYGLHQRSQSLTPIKTQKPLVKYEEVSDVDVHLYRSMIGSLMYLTASRPDIMFAVCACSRFQVTPKTTHLSVVKRIFRYLKGKPKLGLWYPRVSSFDLEAYSDSDYAGAKS
ncbi:hypothetical protein Tco_0333337 [Tanacetum coccineum]